MTRESPRQGTPSPHLRPETDGGNREPQGGGAPRRAHDRGPARSRRQAGPRRSRADAVQHGHGRHPFAPGHPGQQHQTGATSRSLLPDFLAEVGGEQALSDRDRHAIERLSRVKLLTGHPEPVTGCFLSCIAVRSDDQRAVTDLFRLTPTCPATFTLGTIAADCDGHYRLDARRYARVFVTPSLDGWTLLVGPWCDPASQERRDEVLELRLRASAAFGSAQAYRYGERGDGSAWLVTENGTLIRRACNFGSATDEVLLLGPPLPAEIELPAA